MTEIVKDQCFGESLKSEGTEDVVSNFGNSKIKYTRALLLGLKVCCKLPGDFDVLILRELNGESDGTIEKKSISGNSFGHDSLPRTTWNLSLQGEKWDNYLLILDKESHLQRTCSLEERNVACQQLPGEDSCAGVFGRKPPKSDLAQLSKSENPYRPPHCNKKRLQPSTNISESGKESSLGSDQRTSADSITGDEKYEYEDTPLVGVDYSTNKPLGDCEDSADGNEVFVINETIKEIIEEVLEDNQLTFDDYWAETLETIHLFQQQSSISPTNTRANSPDSELEIRFRNLKNLKSGDNKVNLPDEDSLISIHDTIATKKSMPAVNAEGEIKLPDEDSLISIYDLITPESLMALHNSDSNNMRNKSGSPFQFPGLMTQGQLRPQIFGPDKTSHLNFRPLLMIPNMGPCYLTSYSVLQQPNMYPHLLVDASSCLNPPTKPVWNARHFSALPSQQGFESSNAAGGFGNEEASGFSLWHTQF